MDLYDDARCNHCGACCHTKGGSPCEHLRWIAGQSHCDIYNHRFGWHLALDGTRAQCVTIQKEIEEGSGGPDCCAYVQELNGVR